jgi:hypothetical protein
MPRLAIDYSKTIIYKIVCNDLAITDLYVGSTVDFACRKNNHKSKCNKPINKEYNMKIYQVIRANGGWENWTMVMIEPFPCENRLQAERRERYWYEELSASLNSQYPSRTKTEYYNDNKQQITEQRKQYYEANKQQIAEQIKQYYEANKQHIAEQKKQYYQKNKEQKKQYYQKNKEQIAEYQLAYRLKKKTETKGDAL